MAVYHTLVVYDLRSGFWYPEFGDYDLAIVRAEVEDYKYRGEVVKLIMTGDEQYEICAAIRSLNDTLSSSSKSIH